MKLQFTAIYEKVPEGYMAFVEELPGANTQPSMSIAPRARHQPFLDIGRSTTSWPGRSVVIWRFLRHEA